jgi:hypothetical protein
MSDQNDSYSKSDEKHGVADTNRATLTDAEREAIETAIVGRLELGDFATLRNLLERMK